MLLLLFISIVASRLLLLLFESIVSYLIFLLLLLFVFFRRQEPHGQRGLGGTREVAAAHVAIEREWRTTTTPNAGITLGRGIHFVVVVILPIPYGTPFCMIESIFPVVLYHHPALMMTLLMTLIMAS